MTDPANQRMLAEERNRTATLSIHKGVPTSPVEDVMGWIQGAVDNYAKGVYGDWDVYVYEPDTNKSYYQPMVIIMPNDIVQDYNGWLKIKKTDMSRQKPEWGHLRSIFRFWLCKQADIVSDNGR